MNKQWQTSTSHNNEASFTGWSSSNQEAVISVETRGLKVYQMDREEDGEKVDKMTTLADVDFIGQISLA